RDRALDRAKAAALPVAAVGAEGAEVAANGSAGDRAVGDGDSAAGGVDDGPLGVAVVNREEGVHAVEILCLLDRGSRHREGAVRHVNRTPLGISLGVRASEGPGIAGAEGAV